MKIYSWKKALTISKFLTIFTSINSTSQIYEGVKVNLERHPRTIYSINCDRNNLFWLSTDKGIIAFNGYSTVDFQGSSEIGKEIPYSSTTTTNKNILFTCFSGRLVYYDGTRHEYVERKSLNNEKISFAIPIDKKNIIIGTNDGKIIIILNDKTHTIRLPEQNKVISITLLKNTCFIVGTAYGRFYLVNRKKVLKQLPWSHNYNFGPAAYHTFNDSTIIFSNHKGIYLCDTKNFIPKKIVSYAKSILKDPIYAFKRVNNKVYFGNRSGLFELDSKTYKMKQLLKNIHVTTIDNTSDIILLGTKNHGLIKLRPNIKYMTHQFFSDDPIVDRLTDKNQKFITESGKIFRLEDNHFKVDNAIKCDYPNNLTVDNVITLDSKQCFSTNLGGFIYIGGRIKKANNEYFSTVTANSKPGTWFANAYGYGLIKNNKLIYHERKPLAEHFRPTNIVYYPYISGLIILNNGELISNQRLKILKKISANYVTSLIIINDSTLIITTRLNGAYIIKKDLIYLQINKSNYLAQNNCQNLSYYEGALILVNEKGLNFLEMDSNLQPKAIKSLQYGIDIQNDPIKKIYWNDRNNITLISEKGVSSYTFNENKIQYPSATAILIENKEFGTFELNFQHIGLLIEPEVYVRCLVDKKYTITKTNNKIHFASHTRPNSIAYSLSYDRINWTHEKQINIDKIDSFWLNNIAAIILTTLSPIILLLIFQTIYKYFHKASNFQYFLSESKLLALRSQINPHFTFNALNSVQSLIAQDRNTEAISYLLKFSKLLRVSLANSRKTKTSLRQELSLISQYLDIEKERCKSSFTYTIAYNNALNIDTLFIPPMILQPIVENCVKHAFKDMIKEGVILIDIELKSEYLTIKIEDNGEGMKTISKPKPSIGLAIIKERLKLFNGEFKSGTESLIVTSSKRFITGYCVILRFNILKTC